MPRTNAGIVHRDLKPDNLFITEGSDGRPFVKILDFGISKFDPQKTGGLQLTQEGAALGTPYYMPPEQIRGEGSLDARADVYALGVILYECLAGVRPFEAETLAHLAILIHTGQPVPIAQHRADLPPGFAALVHDAMATDRGRRTQTAGELRSLLERYGPVGFRSQIRHSPLPPPSIVPARALSTSAAGVSLRPAAPTKAPKSVLLVVSALGLGTAAAVGGGLWWLRARSAAIEVGSALPIATASARRCCARQRRTRAACAAPSAPLAAPGPSVAAALADSAQPPPPAQPAASARATQSALGSAAPRVAPPRPGRADERGLAKDNPFK